MKKSFVQRWWRRQRRPPDSSRAAGSDKGDEEEAARRDDAARLLQGWVRRWLHWRRTVPPAWSQLLAPRLITEQRRRQLQLEIQIWQQNHRVRVVFNI
jgi:hypothetical protein